MPSAVRHDFPVLERFAYLNAGTCGPLSARVVDAMMAEQRRALEQGRGSLDIDQWRARCSRIRERVGAIIGVPADRVALTVSTTDGCACVVGGLHLEATDEVITTDGEHPGLLGALHGCQAVIKEVEVVGRSSAQVLENISSQVTDRTRLIALSHVLWLNGQVLPIAEIRERTGVPLLVDGAQAVGAIPVAASVADFYTVSGQKWLCGPELTGALYVRDPKRLRPRGFDHGSDELTAARFEMHFWPGTLLAGFLGALEEFPGEGAFQRAAGLASRCRQALSGAGIEVHGTDDDRSPLVAFSVPGDPGEAVAQAHRAGVVIRSLPNGWLRASCGWWNDESDIERLVEVFRGAAPT